MPKKRILLVVDTPHRDLSGNAIVAYWLLARHQIEPILVGTRNEICGLVCYKPDAIVLPHVRYDRNEEILSYAKAQGTAVAVLPTEGLQAISRIGPGVTIGREQYRSHVDLYFSWGNLIADRCRAENLVPNAEIQVTGCPRFDLLDKRYDPFLTSRQTFCEQLGVPVDRPIITWFSNMAYANASEFEFHQLQKRKEDPRSSFFHLEGSLDLESVWRDDQKMFTYMANLYEQLAEENPNWIFLAKPHPLEPSEAYKTRFKRLSNVRVINGAFQLPDIIRHSDVQINWRCTTAAEGWLHDFEKPTISVSLPGLETQTILKEIISGNDPVPDYEGTLDRLRFYLQGGKTPDDILNNRNTFLEQHFSRQEGRSGERIAEHLSRLIDSQRSPRRTVRNVAYVLRHYAPHVLRHGRLVYEKRTVSHPKYISRKKVDDIFQIMNKAFDTQVTSTAVQFLI